MIVGRPARELAPFDGLELAARKFQRPFGECAGGRETDDRAKQACEDPAPRRAPRPLCKLPTRLHTNQCTADRNGSAARARVFLGGLEGFGGPAGRIGVVVKTEIGCLETFRSTRVNFLAPRVHPDTGGSS